MRSNFCNYHMHTTFSDGKDVPEAYVKAAISKGMHCIGFSDHCPLSVESEWNMKEADFIKYLKKINFMKEYFRGDIQILTGLEIDYIEGISGVQAFKHTSLDYCIGAVHFLKNYANGAPFVCDTSIEEFEKGLKQIFNGDIKELVEYYYTQIINMIKTSKPDIVAHIDLIKKFNKNNRFFNENDDWYKEIVFEVVREIFRANCILEVNTAGVYRSLTIEYFPSNVILEFCAEQGVSLTLSSDAHHPLVIEKAFPQALELLNGIGYNEIFILDNRGWRPAAFTPDLKGIII